MQADHTTRQGAAGSRPATVLQVVPRLVTGGVERGCVDIAAALAARGDRALVASAGGAMVYELERAGAEHLPLPLHRKDPFSLWRNVHRLSRVIDRYGVDIVHARSRAPAWSALLAARRSGVAFVTTFHGTYNFKSEWKRRYNAVMTKGDRVIAISEFIADHIWHNYDVAAERLRVVPRGVDLARFNPAAVSANRIVSLAGRWRLPEDRPVVMLPGRLTRWKGHMVLIEALARVKARGFCCMLVGSDEGAGAYRGELETRIAELGLSEHVLIRGDCNDMPAAYMLADVVVSASVEPEAFGRVAGEAQAMGRPLVAANHGGVPEQVIDGETARLVAPGDPDDLAGGLDWALGLDASERERVAAAGRRQAEHFAKTTMCARTLAVYDELLCERPAEGASARGSPRVLDSGPAPASLTADETGVRGLEDRN